MKENIAQSNMLPTQSGKRMAQGLGGVQQQRKESRNGLLPCSTT